MQEQAADRTRVTVLAMVIVTELIVQVLSGAYATKNII